MTAVADVAIAVVTVPERAEYLNQVLLGLGDHVRPGCSRDIPMAVFSDYAHHGVAENKNKALRWALATTADWFFISEDDVVVQSHMAVTGYLATARDAGCDHLAFHAHGPANDPGPVGTDHSGAVTFWPHYVGAWCLYSRRSIETCGLFDEHFMNSWDHVEHTLRLSLAGFHPMPGDNHELRAADATGSELWLSEIPGAIENTSIPHTPDWIANRERGRAYWRREKPETYNLVFSR